MNNSESELLVENFEEEPKSNSKTKLQRCRNQPEAQFKVQSIGNNINLISQDFANTFISNNRTASSSKDITVDDSNFPSLGQQVKHKKYKKGIEYKSGVKNENVFVLQDFIKNKPSHSINNVKKKSKYVTPTKYTGNLLDSSLPVRKSGKSREIPKPKRLTKLKQEIIQEQLECNQNCEEKNIYIFGANIITDDEVTCKFLSRVVELQEKLFKRDCIKGKSKRRYVVGLHEAKKYLLLGKVKILIIANDIKLTKENGALQTAIEELIDLCVQNNTYYFFGLKRRKLGNLTLKYIPISCIAILNYEGAEGQFNELKKFSTITQQEELNSHIVEEPSMCLNNVFENKMLELLKNK